jgi:hypothetical protein
LNFFVLVIRILNIRNCFGLRASDFEFIYITEYAPLRGSAEVARLASGAFHCAVGFNDSL